MIDTLHNFYLSRFGKLPEEIQTRVLEKIDAGAAVVSKYDPATGTSSCILTGDPSETLWADIAFSKTEAAALGEAITAALNNLSLREKRGVGEVLDEGARIVAVVEHSGFGRAEIHVAQHGKIFRLTKLDAPGTRPQ